MNKLKNMLVALIAITAISTSSFAGNMSLGLVTSLMEVDAAGTENDTLTAGGANVADTSVRSLSKNADVTTGSLYVEYTTEMRLPISFGVEYTPGEAEIQGASTRSENETSTTGSLLAFTALQARTAGASATNFATAYVEVPLFKGLYVRGGMSNMTVLHSNDSGLGGSTDLTGTNLGVGYKMTTGGGLHMKLAYEQTDYDSISLRSSNNSVVGETTSVNADVDTSAVRFSLGKNF
jgi:hypothetical protein